MKIIITLILLILFNEGYSQKTPVTVPEHYRLWLVDSSKQSNIDKIQDEATKRNADGLTASSANDAYIDSTNSYLTVRNKQVSVKIDLVTTAVIAKLPPIPPPTDLTAILNRLTNVENELIATKGIASTALANTATLNDRLAIAEQINNILATQITALQQTIKDSSSALRSADAVLNTKFNGLNSAVYLRMNTADAGIATLNTRMNTNDSKIAALDTRVKKLEVKP